MDHNQAKEVLLEYFQVKQESWEALKAEFQACRDNARNSLESRDCRNREWFGGKLEMLRELEDLEKQYNKKLDTRRLDAKR